MLGKTPGGKIRVGIISAIITMAYSFQIVTASALERRMVLQKHWKRLEKEAEKDLQPRKNTRKMKKRQKYNASDNATSSATDTMGKAEPEMEKPEPETDPVVHVPVAQYVTEETDLLQLLRDNLPVISTKGASNVNCNSRNKYGGLEPSSVSAYREGQNTGINTTCGNNVGTIVRERPGNLNPSAQCSFTSSSKTSDIVSTDEPRTLNQDASLRKYHMNSSTENPNTSVLSTNIKNCKEESESATRTVTSDSGAVTGSAIDVNDDRESSSSSLMLTGLHTCGNLAPNLFRIFLANPDARFLCNVGCCYQLLTEEFWTEDGYTKGKPP